MSVPEGNVDQSSPADLYTPAVEPEKQKEAGIFLDFAVAVGVLNEKASRLLSYVKDSKEYVALKSEILADASAARARLVTLVSSL